MTFKEKLTWVSAVVTAAVGLAYGLNVGRQITSVPVESIAYQRPLLVAVGAIIALTIVGSIATSIATAIGSAISTTVSGEGTIEEAMADIDRSDERDTQIEWRGDRIGYFVSSGLMIGVLALAMLRFDQFWIANALFSSFIVSGLAASLAKITAYRLGL